MNNHKDLKVETRRICESLQKLKFKIADRVKGLKMEMKTKTVIKTQGRSNELI